ncbi:lysozyme [Yersinia enterocolitica]|uniref:lysozyme n=1 Tax=Yersinia enterocolitica TaxID=630 RepID=UPI00155A55E9|nr:lysozyme [Yersinia enterocolitica]EKN6262670.1 lysozyme [Yersinia enterocolitica]MBX9484433.1 lysozyme [Yersinia enterocolitica]NQS93331.1 lysozyme [Yersinia enterocolitica]NQT42471.1 lysozyme [Yersinia enterocolitica]NQU00023.1 lysozyme [Yersinia enterocolitica]
MAIPQRLMTKIAGVVTGGAMAIAIVLLGGSEGLEGREYTPYRDVVGVLTVCDGHTGKDIIPSKRYSDAECDALLHQDLLPVFATIDRIVNVPISDFRKAALASFGYNVGITAMTNSTMVKKLNRGDTSGACDELRRWIKAGGKVWKGLINRREVERELCLMP